MLLRNPSDPVDADRLRRDDLGNPSVLVVDATGTRRQAAAQALTASGYIVTQAATGAEAMLLAAQADFDVVVIDVDLPDIDGLDLGRRLKEPARGLLPILHVSTVRVSWDDRLDALYGGVDAYLVHPVANDELNAAVAALIRLRRAEEARRRQLAASSVLTDALDALADHVALLDADGIVIAVNRAWTDFARDNQYAGGGDGLGVNYPELCEQATGDGAVEARRVGQGVRDVLAGKQQEFITEYPCHAPGEERWFELVVRRVANPGKGGVAAVVTHRNVTVARQAARVAELERQRAELAYAGRARDEALFRALTEQSLEFVAILEADGAFRYVSPSVTRTLGYSPDELIGRYPVEFVHEDDRATMLSTYRALSEGGHGAVAEMTVRLRHRDGSWRYFEGGGQNMLDHAAVRGITSNARDVTARVEERIRLAAVFQDAPSFIAMLRGPDHRFERVNTAFERLVGRTDLVGKTVVEALPEVQSQRFARILDEVRATGQSVVRHAVPVYLARSGTEVIETRYLNVVYQPLADDDDCIVVHGLDITNHVETVNALRATEARLREQFAKLPVPTLLWEAEDDGSNFILLDLNEAAHTLIPDGESAIGRRISDLFPGYLEMLIEARRSLDSGAVVHHSVDYESAPGAGVRAYELTIGAQPPDRLLVHAVDVTEQRRMSQELRQAQKMEAVGQLAGGIAHDFNNLLTVIGAHTAFLLDQLHAGDPSRADAVAIQQAGDRAAALTRQLLAFSRKQMLSPAVVDLNVAVEGIHRMVGRLVGEDIEVILQTSPDLGRVLVDLGQVEQVLINLVLNARDAMPGGGQLTIATTNADVTRASGLPEFMPDGQYAVLTVTDTGVGMDLETQSRIFEPFFTTKEPGKGTGLGLSTVYGIVKQSGGFVFVTSAPGAGTTFDVYLPLVDKPATVAPGAQPVAHPGGGETILVVEDDPAVRQIATRTLSRQGYRVLEAKDGRAALLLAEQPTPIDVVLSDAVMPGMSGVEVLNEIRKRHPGCRAMLMSGYADDEMTRRGIRTADVAFLQKPFAPAELARRVRHLLEN